MENITSLNSPHIERVKALLGPRGKKNRELEDSFIVEGIQAVREALKPKLAAGLAIKNVYVTDSGLAKLALDLDAKLLGQFEIIKVTDQIMNAMADSESPQGIIALCSTNSMKLSDLWRIKPVKIALFWQIQDPGNAGTVIRSADAAGFDAVVFSTDSVDVFNPKTVRATAGSLWHIPVISDVDIDTFVTEAKANGLAIFALTSDGQIVFDSNFVLMNSQRPTVWIFGNEARGLPVLPREVTTVAIPMKGFAESLNVASAAAIVLHSVGLAL